MTKDATRKAQPDELVGNENDGDYQVDQELRARFRAEAEEQEQFYRANPLRLDVEYGGRLRTAQRLKRWLRSSPFHASRAAEDGDIYWIRLTFPVLERANQRWNARNRMKRRDDV